MRRCFEGDYSSIALLSLRIRVGIIDDQ
jgi:hypothetical protein